MRRRPERSRTLALPVAILAVVIGATGCGSCGKGSEPENAPAPPPLTSAGKLGQKMLRTETTENNPRPIPRLGREDAAAPTP